MQEVIEKVIAIGPYDAATLMVFEACEKSLRHELFCPVHGEFPKEEEAEHDADGQTLPGYFLLEEGEEEDD